MSGSKRPRVNNQRRTWVAVLRLLGHRRHRHRHFADPMLKMRLWMLREKKNGRPN